jgi:hypothetical protein
MRNKKMYIFTYSNTKKMPPVSPPMMINVKECMVREIFFVFQWWRQKISLGTIGLGRQTPLRRHCA